VRWAALRKHERPQVLQPFLGLFRGKPPVARCRRPSAIIGARFEPASIALIINELVTLSGLIDRRGDVIKSEPRRVDRKSPSDSTFLFFGDSYPSLDGGACHSLGVVRRRPSRPIVPQVGIAVGRPWPWYYFGRAVPVARYVVLLVTP